MLLKLETADKTFTAETIDISFGVIEDIINVLDFDNISDSRQIGTSQFLNAQSSSNRS